MLLSKRTGVGFEPVTSLFRAVTTIFILGGGGGGGLEVTIGGGFTMVEAEELRKYYDFQTSKHAITGHTLG